MTTFYCLRFETVPTWRARSPYLYHPGRGWPVIPRSLGSLFVASYDSQGYGGGVGPRLHTGYESESYVTTDAQSASLFWNKAPIWGLRPDFYNCQTVVSLLIWGALSDERTGLSFTIAAGSRQHSHSCFLAPLGPITIFLFFPDLYAF
jgi:hypothetical protein